MSEGTALYEEHVHGGKFGGVHGSKLGGVHGGKLGGEGREKWGGFMTLCV